MGLTKVETEEVAYVGEEPDVDVFDPLSNYPKNFDSPITSVVQPKTSYVFKTKDGKSISFGRSELPKDKIKEGECFDLERLYFCVLGRKILEIDKKLKLKGNIP